MNMKKFNAKAIWLVIFSVFLLMGGITGLAAAEQPAPASEGGNPDNAFTPAGSGEASPETAAAALEPDDNKPGATRLFKYLTVAGSTFNPRNGATTVAYASNGCIYESSAIGPLTTALNLPNGATIKYIRLYYNVTDATNYVYSFLTYYSPGTNYVDAVVVASPTGGPGIGSVLSSKVSIKVKNKKFAYALLANPSAAVWIRSVS